ncbi:MAG: AAA family ATPase, partial [Ignavibacteriaceae bacterium]|nr:AAA family ATPase [Ignavibacteriaceae bacterium]
MSEADFNEITGETTAGAILESFSQKLKLKDFRGKIFLLIDEYDHFTNELISFDQEHFREIVSRNGWVRKFYEVVKQLMAEGIIDRFFATGVTPVTLDSMTSGFNVAQNITLDHKFHSLTGFTESEVVKLISETMPAGEQFDPLELLNNLRSWYNGSRFSPSAEEKLYNPQMILSFLREFRDTYTYSGMMSDINVTSDWKKIDNIISQLPPGTAESVIDQVLNNDYITDSLTLLYNPETPFTKTDVISLLFYNGLLSIDGITAGFYKYVIPNYLIRQLYWEFFRNRMEREKNLDLSSN